MSLQFVKRRTWRDNHCYMEYLESQDGTLKTWHIDGELWKEEFYDNGELIKKLERFKPVINHAYRDYFTVVEMESWKELVISGKLLEKSTRTFSIETAIWKKELQKMVDKI